MTASHLAVSVRACVTGVVKSQASSAPSANHPRNIDAADAGSSGALAAVPQRTLCASGTGVPPAASKVTCRYVGSTVTVTSSMRPSGLSAASVQTGRLTVALPPSGTAAYPSLSRADRSAVAASAVRDTSLPYSSAPSAAIASCSRSSASAVPSATVAWAASTLASLALGSA